MTTSSVRPIYETAGTLASESAIADRLAQMTGTTYRKMPRSYGADYLFFRAGRAVGVCEIKCRSNDRGRYRDYFIALRKIMDMQELGERLEVPAILAVTWAPDETIWTYVVNGIRPHVGWGGRSDRGDPADHEPVALINVALFQPASAGLL